MFISTKKSKVIFQIQRNVILGIFLLFPSVPRKCKMSDLFKKKKLIK